MLMETKTKKTLRPVEVSLQFTGISSGAVTDGRSLSIQNKKQKRG